MTLRARLRALWPEAHFVGVAEPWRAALGALIAIGLTSALSQWFQPGPAGLWLVAPMGASAVLLLALPSSPLTQPWSVIGGNTVSAVIGLAVCHWIPELHLAAGLAVGLALLTMFSLRCLHPPGGAMALMMVLTHTLDWGFALSPVLLNSVLLVLLSTVYNRISGRSYPHAAKAAPLPEATSPHFTTADLDAALRHHNQLIDMDRQDLQALLHNAQAHAYERTLGQLRCADIMSTQLVTVRGHETLPHAWQLLMDHHIKSLPVVDELGHVMGIITRADFIAHWHGSEKRHLSAVDGTVVRQLMSRRVRVASDTTRMIDLLPLFSHEGHHHLPIVNAEHVLVGMVTESDVVKALCRAVC